ncbi:hypothetical protein HMI54_012184 [Coelomomyces lativittatus]|nr:hypothetical protein HMI54_012184 [Coelomomyces lativittatus]
MTKLPAFKYAPLLPCHFHGGVSGGRLPVMFFSHGLRGCKGTYSYFCGDMASHGMIVVAIEHRDRSACVTLHKHQVRHYQQAPLSNLGPDDFTFRHAQILHRAKEVEWAHHFLRLVETGGYGPLASWKHRIRLDQWIMAGHSFGGATTLHILQHQKFPFSCGFVMDPWCFPIEQKRVKSPVATSNSSNFHWKENIEAFQQICDTSLDESTKYRFPNITIKNTAHTNHSDVPLFFPNLASKSQFAGTCDPHFALHLNNQFCLSFLNHTLPELMLPKTPITNTSFSSITLEEFIHEKHSQITYGFVEAR